MATGYPSFFFHQRPNFVDWLYDISLPVRVDVIHRLPNIFLFLLHL